MKEITIKDLAKIIKLCKSNGISSLKYGDIEISIAVPEKPAVTSYPQARGSAKKAKIVAEKADLQDQFDRASEDLETLHLEDPAGYEALLIRGELGVENH